MKSRKFLFAGLLLAGLAASAVALKAHSAGDGGRCGGEQTECCDKVCAPLCCPGH